MGIAGFRDQTKFSIKSTGGDYYCLSFLQKVRRTMPIGHEIQPGWTRNARLSFTSARDRALYQLIGAPGSMFLLPQVLCVDARPPCLVARMRETLTST